MVETSDTGRDSSRVPTIGDLIQAELDAGKSVRDLAAASGYRVKHQTFQELSRQPPKQFPKESKTVTGMAQALNCTESAIVLAYAAGLGIAVDSTSEFSLRMPPGVDDLAPEMKNALVSVVRAAVKQNGVRDALPTDSPAQSPASPEGDPAQEVPPGDRPGVVKPIRPRQSDPVDDDDDDLPDDDELGLAARHEPDEPKD